MNNFDRFPQVPHMIHIVWLFKEEMPDVYKGCAERIKQLHPDWEIKIWNRGNFPEIIHRKQIIQLHDEGLFGFAAGSAGIALLSHYGGLYLDFDIFLFRPISPLTYSCPRMLVMRNSSYYGTHAMASKPQDNYFIRAASFLPHTIAYLKTHSVPQYAFTPSTQFYYAEKKDQDYKTKLIPTAVSCLALPEACAFAEELRTPTFRKPLSEGRVPAFCYGARINNDHPKYHNQQNKLNDLVENAKENLKFLSKRVKDVNIIF